MKYCVFGLWTFSCIMFLFAPLSVLSGLCLAIFGTYLLAEETECLAFQVIDGLFGYMITLYIYHMYDISFVLHVCILF